MDRDAADAGPQRDGRDRLQCRGCADPLRSSACGDRASDGNRGHPAVAEVGPPPRTGAEVDIEAGYDAGAAPDGLKLRDPPDRLGELRGAGGDIAVQQPASSRRPRKPFCCPIEGCALMALVFLDPGLLRRRVRLESARPRCRTEAAGRRRPGGRWPSCPPMSSRVRGSAGAFGQREATVTHRVICRFRRDVRPRHGLRLPEPQADDPIPARSRRQRPLPGLPLRGNAMRIDLTWSFAATALNGRLRAAAAAGRSARRRPFRETPAVDIDFQGCRALDLSAPFRDRARPRCMKIPSHGLRATAISHIRHGNLT